MPSGASQFQIENEISDFQSTSASPFTETDSNAQLNDFEEQIAQDHRSILHSSLYSRVKQFCLQLNSPSSSAANCEQVARFVEILSVGISASRARSTELEVVEKYVLVVAHSMPFLFGSIITANNTASGKKQNSASQQSLIVNRAKSKVLGSLVELLSASKGQASKFEAGDCFLKCLCKIPNSFLEYSSELRSSGAASEVKSTLAQIYSLLAKQFPLCQLTCKSFLTQSFQHFEEIGEFVADVVACASSDSFQLDAFGNEIILAVVEPASAINEVSIKNLIGFLCQLTKVMPKGVQRNLSVICQLLDVEAHSLRISILECIYQLVVKGESEDSAENAPRKGAESLASLINVLFERILDTNSFVRTKTLSLLSSLCTEGRMNAGMVDALWNASADRLKDKASNVRRRALIVLSEILKKHPFSFDGGQLNLQTFRCRLAQCEEAIEKANEAQLDTLLVQKKYYNDACKFGEKVKQVLVFVTNSFLYCQNKTEVNEAIEFICVCHVYQIEGSSEALGKTLPLVWSKDSSGDDESKRSIREHLIGALKIVLFEGCSNGEQIAQNLTSFHQTHYNAYSETVDEILQVFCEKKFIPASSLEHLYKFFIASDSSTVHGKHALSILVLLTSSAHFKTASSFFTADRVKTVLCDQRVKQMAEYATLATKFIGSTCTNKSNYQLIVNFIGETILVNSTSANWIPAIQASIDVLFQICAQPVATMETIVKKIVAECSSSSKSLTLAKLIFIIGHLALKADIQLARLQQQHQQASKAFEKKSKATDSASIEEHVSSATFEESIADFYTLIRERELLFASDALLAPFRELVVWIINHPQRFSPNSLLYSMSALSLAKLMATSEEFCKQQMPKFLELLTGNTVNERIQSNLIVAFGDFTTSFPSLMDEHIVVLYERLLDHSIRVRINSLLVLSWLILNGMIKVKGQLHLITLCFLDSDPKIAHLSQTFFQDLGTKDPNAIYNAIPDLISNLSSHFDSRQEEFIQIMRQVFALLKREKQIDNVIVKILARLNGCMQEKVAANLFACLSLLFGTGEAKVLERIIESYPTVFADKLWFLQQGLVELIAKAKKTESLVALASQLELLMNTEAKTVEPESSLKSSANENVAVGGKPSLITRLAGRLRRGPK